jgi:hypothetical protein
MIIAVFTVYVLIGALLYLVFHRLGCYGDEGDDGYEGVILALWPLLIIGLLASGVQHVMKALVGLNERDIK